MISLKKIMTRDVVSVKRTTDIFDAIRMMSDGNITGLPVVDEDEKLCNELLELFVRDFPSQMDSLREAMAKKDEKLVAEQAYKIKGTSEKIGAHSLWEIAGQIDTVEKVHDMVYVQKIIETLGSEFERLEPKLNGFK